MENISTVKQVSRIEYEGPCQIQATSGMSTNFSAHIDNYNEIKIIIPTDAVELKFDSINDAQ